MEWFTFKPEYLDQLSKRYSDSYREAYPFPHFYIDHFLPETVLNKITEEFPRPNEIEWSHQYDNPAEKKLACDDETRMGPFTRNLIYQFRSSVFMKFLEDLTGIEGLIPDPTLFGGGLHQIESGGYLKIHADFNWHPQLRLYRRLNLLLYLNQNWKEEYGGHFELWNREMSKAEVRLLPLFNRCVVFSTSNESYHGHPDPLTCPLDQTRKSIALYYYTSYQPNGETSTSQHSTLFKKRSPKDFNLSKKMNIKKIAKKIIPPIFIEAFHYLQRRSIG